MVRDASVRGRWLLAIWIASSALSEAGATDLLPGDIFFSFRYDDLSPRDNGIGFELRGLKPISESFRAELGVAYNDVADSRWTYGILGGYLQFNEARDNAFLQVQAGRGNRREGGFDYFVGKTGLSHALIDKRLYIEAEFQPIRVAELEQNLGKLGVGLVPWTPLYVQIHYYANLFGGDRNARIWSGRLDYTYKSITVFGGGSTSTETVDVLSAARGLDPNVSSVEYFVGVTLPIKKNALTIVFNNLDQENAGRKSVIAVWKWSLGN